MTGRTLALERDGGIQFLTGRGESVSFIRGPRGTCTVQAMDDRMGASTLDVPLTRMDVMSLHHFLAELLMRSEGQKP